MRYALAALSTLLIAGCASTQLETTEIDGSWELVEQDNAQNYLLGPSEDFGIPGRLAFRVENCFDEQNGFFYRTGNGWDPITVGIWVDLGDGIERLSREYFVEENVGNVFANPTPDTQEMADPVISITNEGLPLARLLSLFESSEGELIAFHELYRNSDSRGRRTFEHLTTWQGSRMGPDFFRYERRLNKQVHTIADKYVVRWEFNVTPELVAELDGWCE